MGLAIILDKIGLLQASLAFTADRGDIMQVNVNAYPQLRLLCWNRRDNTVLDGEEAFRLYENYWRFVEPDKFSDEEKRLLDALIERFGNGVFLP